jgi:hypothetical protein
LSEGYCGIRKRAPYIGEQNDEIYIKEMGMTAEEISTLKENGVI